MNTNGNLNGYISTPAMGIGTVLVLAVGGYYLYKAMTKKSRKR